MLFAPLRRKFRLRTALLIPLILQTVAAVGLMSYLFALTGEINAGTRSTLWLVLGALVLAIASGIAIAHWLTQQILGISRTSTAIAEGNMNQYVASSNVLEIDRLASSFNRITEGMKGSLDALRQSEARNQAMLNAIPDLILRIHRDGRYLDIQSSGETRLLAPRENQIGKTVHDVLPNQELAQQYLDAIHRAIQSGGMQEFEYQLQMGEDTVDYEARVVKSSDDEVIAMVRNITDRKRNEVDRQQAEMALIQSEERYRGLVSNIPGAIYRCRCDENWTFEYVSDAIKTISGYTAAELTDNRDISYSSMVHPDDRDLIDVIISHALIIQEPYVLDYRIQHRNGSIRWVYEQGKPIFDAEDNPLWLDGAIFDVTDRKEAEEALRIAEENYRSIFENALEGIFQSSPDGRYLSVNPAMAKIYGYTSPQQMIATITDIASQVYVNRLDRVEFQRQLETNGQVRDFEYQVYQQNGAIIWIQEDARAVRDSTGKVLYYEGMVQDITDRKRREEELKRQLEELKIEIDQTKREKEVAMLTESTYFQEVQREVEEINLDEFWS